MIGKEILQEIIKIIKEGGFICIDGHLATIVNFNNWKDDPENEVIYLGWEEENQEYSEKITEEDLTIASINNGSIIIPDNDKTINITLYHKSETKPTFQHPMVIINLTQHKPTPEQVSQGVVSIPEENYKEVINLLNFDEIPFGNELLDRANKIADIVESFIVNNYWDSERPKVMIGGAPFFMSHLEKALHRRGINYLYAFSKRISKEIEKNGKTEKISTFEHVGFVDPNLYKC